MPEIQKQIEELEDSICKHNDGLNLQIAINYGSRDEMIRAMKKMVQDHDARQTACNRRSMKTQFDAYLDTQDIPDPDLLIRTSGEQRLVELSFVAAGIQ